MIDHAKRRAVMSRSMALGHCICDPRTPCPCPTLKDEDRCPCAGERPAARPDRPVRLTELVRSAGCASKLPKAELGRLLAGLPDFPDPRVLVGRGTCDDAGVIRLGPGTDTVLTVDVFAPVVDDPWTFGQIAAANSVSDIYAMGATPQTALAIVGFPLHDLPGESLRAMMEGAFAKLADAGIGVIGGHTLNSAEPFCGFAVLGTCPAGGALTNAGAEPGHVLVLSKPLGTGIIAFAHQIGRVSAGAMDAAARSMSALNREAAAAAVAGHASACTDVTGFSLLGHLGELARQSGVEAVLDPASLPVLPEALALARAGVLPGAVERNREGLPPGVIDLSGAPAGLDGLLFGPETSGGLLVALPAAAVGPFRDRVPGSAVIGRIAGRADGGRVRFESGPGPAASAPPPAAVASAAPLPAVPVETPACCAQPPAAAASGSLPPPAAADAFASWMKAASAPGALDARTKKLMAFALSVATRCEPCVKINAEAARAQGASDAELSEAAALGIAFGGAPAGMAYNRLRS